MILAACASMAGADISAQQLEPRTYSNAPVGMNFLVVGYGYATGSIISDPAVPLENADIDSHETVLGYARVLDVWGRSGKVDVVLPYAWASGSATYAGEYREREVSGPGDPRLRFSVNLCGAPALSLKEFAGYRQNFIFGASLQVIPPLGQYDDGRLLNIGTNRWTVKPELGISKTVGPLTIELAAATAFFTDNTGFIGGATQAQDNIHSFQAHLIYNLRSGIWIALNGIYYTGGCTTVNGVEKDDSLDNVRGGLTVALPVSRRNSLKLFGSTGISSRMGTDFDILGAAWQYRWGGGL